MEFFSKYVVVVWLAGITVGCSIGAVVLWIDKKRLPSLVMIVMALLFGFGVFIWLGPGPSSDPFTVWVALFILAVVSMGAIRFLGELWR
jgi:hypothetical protein